MLENVKDKKKYLPIIAIIGVDGSGKSTILSSLTKTFKHNLVRKIFILNRPSKTTAVGKPIHNYEKPPHSKLYSTVKLLYRAFRWTIRYYFELSPMKHAGVLILCDHFSFLGIALDPLKSRYGGPHTIVKLVLRMIPQPDIYIFLDAPLDIIFSRKQEATQDEMEQLIMRHRKYMSEISNGYIVNAANPVEQVTTSVSEIINQVIEQS